MFELAKLRIYQAKGEIDGGSEVVEVGKCSGGEQMEKRLYDCSKRNNCGLNDECGGGTNIKDGM